MLDMAYAERVGFYYFYFCATISPLLHLLLPVAHIHAGPSHPQDYWLFAVRCCASVLRHIFAAAACMQSCTRICWCKLSKLTRVKTIWLTSSVPSDGLVQSPVPCLLIDFPVNF